MLRVVLLGAAGDRIRMPPGRHLLVNSAHTFAEIAVAIDRAFARWDISHLHEFELGDGRRVASADDDEFEEADLDEAIETLERIKVEVGTRFRYTFDLGAGWEHECMVTRTDVDPVEDAGVAPPSIVPIFGWGAIPDQYGRLRPDDEG